MYGDPTFCGQLHPTPQVFYSHKSSKQPPTLCRWVTLTSLVQHPEQTFGSCLCPSLARVQRLLVARPPRGQPGPPSHTLGPARSPVSLMALLSAAHLCPALPGKVWNILTYTVTLPEFIFHTTVGKSSASLSAHSMGDRPRQPSCCGRSSSGLCPAPGRLRTGRLSFVSPEHSGLAEAHPPCPTAQPWQPHRLAEEECFLLQRLCLRLLLCCHPCRCLMAGGLVGSGFPGLMAEVSPPRGGSRTQPGLCGAVPAPPLPPWWLVPWQSSAFTAALAATSL